MSLEHFQIPSATTWKLLQESQNTHCTILLGAGLLNPNSEIRQMSLQILLDRGDDASLMLALSNWPQFNMSDKILLTRYASQLAPALKKLFLKGSNSVKGHMLRAIGELNLTDLADILVELASNSSHPLNPLAVESLHEMCRRLGCAARASGRLPSAAPRTALMRLLTDELNRNPDNIVLLESWLMLAHWDDGQLRGVISDACNPLYQPLIDYWSRTSEPQALQLLAGYFPRQTTTIGLLNLIQSHPACQLAAQLALTINDETIDFAIRRLKSMGSLACFRGLDPSKLDLDRAAEQRLLLLMAASLEDIPWTLSNIVRLSKGTTFESRKLAAEMLGCMRCPSIELLVRQIQSESLVSQSGPLMECIHEILLWRESASTQLRQACQLFFSEFTAEELLLHIGRWPMRMCRVMADIVQKSDPNRLDTLRSFLTSPAPRNRLAAIRAVELLSCADSVRDLLLTALADPKLEVRVAVVDVLSALDDSYLPDLLPKLLADANTDVVEAATRAKRRLEKTGVAVPHAPIAVGADHEPKY